MFIDLRERGRGREGEREREREWHRCEKHRSEPPMRAPTEDRPSNLGMCPDGESNPQSLVYGTMLQPTEPLGQGHLVPSKKQQNVKQFPLDLQHSDDEKHQCSSSTVAKLPLIQIPLDRKGWQGQRTQRLGCKLNDRRGFILLVCLLTYFQPQEHNWNIVDAQLTLKNIEERLS